MPNLFVKAFRFIIDYDFGKIFDRPDLPLGFRICNYILLVTILPWPILLFGSIFLFDAPSNEAKAYPIFFMIFIYPFFILASTIVGFKNYRNIRVLSYVCTMASAIFISMLAYKLYTF
jgi:hypothetical protein